MEERRSPFLPLLAILLCMTTIVGATFALFTSKKRINITAKAAEVNVLSYIKKETFKTYSMDVEQAPETFELGGTAVLEDDGQTLTLSEMAPGDKVVFTVEMKNMSTIDIKWCVSWDITGELAEALEITADGAAPQNTTMTEWAYASETVDTMEIVIELPETVGDEYQTKTAQIVFTVDAIQGNAP